MRSSYAIGINLLSKGYPRVIGVVGHVLLTRALVAISKFGSNLKMLPSTCMC